MARMHGSQVRVYINGRDASGDLATVSPKPTAATHDTTTFAAGGWVQSDAGLLGCDCGIEAFYDPAAGGIGQQLEAIGGAFVVSIFDGDANAIGDSGILLPAGPLETRETPIGVTDMVKLTGNVKGNGRPGLFAKLLHPLGAETGSGNGASLDNTASSASGGRATLHVTGITGTWTVTVQHSANNADWADLVTFTQVAEAGGITAETKEVSGDVNRYLRVAQTEDVAGTLTFVVGFARY